MTRAKLTFRGWKSIPVIVLIAGFVLYRACEARADLEEGGLNVLRQHLRGEYASAIFARLGGSGAGARDRETLARTAGEIERLERITFRQVSVRGTAPDLIVRVEILVDGGPPPSGSPVEYFRLSHSLVTGWRVEGHTTALSYYLKVF